MHLLTKDEVEKLISRIIHQDSFGDVHHEANKVAKEYNMNFDKQTDDDVTEAIEEIEGNYYDFPFPPGFD